MAAQTVQRRAARKSVKTLSWFSALGAFGCLAQSLINILSRVRALLTIQ